MARCRITGCRKEATAHSPYTFKRYGEVQGPPNGTGVVWRSADDGEVADVCPDHREQAKRMKKHFNEHKIGYYQANSVLLKLDKREVPFAEVEYER